MLFLGQIEWKRRSEALSELRKLKHERNILNQKIEKAEERYETAQEDYDRVFGQEIEQESNIPNGQLYGSYIERWK